MSAQLLYILALPQLILFGTIDRIQKSMEKKEYEKAYELIEKGLEKEPENPGIYYYKALLYFDREFNQYQLDSARVSIRAATQKFDQAPLEEQQNSIEEGITEQKISMLAERIRDREFQNTLETLSIEHILGFEQKYPQSIYAEILTFKKDSIAFSNAARINSQDSYRSFIRSHPTSVFVPLADSILDHLRVEELFQKGSLQDYYDYLLQFPFTRRRAEVELYILKVSTAAHLPRKYPDFLNFSRVAALKKIAGDYYYRLTHQVSNKHPYADSLTATLPLKDKVVFPTLKEGRFGFYDQKGLLAIDHKYTDVPLSSKCQLVTDDWIFVKSQEQGKILRKDGFPVLTGVSDYRSISDALALVQRRGNWYLYHKSGNQIYSSPVESAELAGDKWIRIKQNNKIGLISFLGLPIAQPDYDEIYSLGPFWIFEKNDRIAVSTEDAILGEVEDKGLALEFKFDDIEWVNDSTLIGYRGNRECMLDQSLNFLISWGEYEINPDPNGWYLRLRNGYKLYDAQESEILKRMYSYIETSRDWLALKTSDDWMLIPRIEGILPSREYDSIKLIGNYAAWLQKGEEKSLLFSSGKQIDIDKESLALLGENEDHLLMKGLRSLKLINQEGVEILDENFQEMSFINDTLLRVQTRGKQGILTIYNKWLLPPDYETLDEKAGLILTLKDQKIGCYDLMNRTLIGANYEARIERIGSNYLAKQEDKYGLIDATQDPLLPFDYSQISFWNDTSYLAAKDGSFQIVGLTGEPLTEPFESATKLLSNADQEVYRLIRNGKYGLISNTYGELLKPEYTEVINIGSEEVPLFFADQHLDKAGFHVVSYIDEKGLLIISKAYTKEEFERILCDD